MKTQPKPCKGIGKAIGVKGCGNTSSYRKYGLCPSCLSDFLFDTDAGKLFNKSVLKPAKKIVEKKAKQTEKKMRSESTNWKPKLQSKLQLIARLIDKGQPCPARGFINCQFHGGHVFTKGGKGNMALNLHNIHRQSAQSNWKQSDDYNFRMGLSAEYGSDYIDFIDSLRQTPVSMWRNKDYEVFYYQACKIANRLRKADLVYSKQERIELRNSINAELGIYDESYCRYELKNLIDADNHI